MKYCVFILLIFAAPLASLAQSHTNDWGCKNFVLGPRNPGESPRASPDPIPGCPACIKERKDKYEAQRLKDQQAAKEYEERIAKEAARRKEVEEARLADLKKRNASAIAKLSAVNQDNEDYNRIRRAEKARRNEVNARFEQEMTAANKEYKNHLAQLQEASRQVVGPSDDDFWNETVAPANYFAVIDPETRMISYENKQKKQILPPRYSYGSPMINGVAFVLEKPETSYKLINNKGETIRQFDNAYLNQISKNGTVITRMNHPDTISDGVMVVDFSVKDRYREGTYGVIDKAGELVVDPVFYEIGKFKNGLAIASKFIKDDEISFENGNQKYVARFTYLETGLINKEGKWIGDPKKKLVYYYGFATKMVINVTTSDTPKYTEEEEKAREAAQELEGKKQHDLQLAKLDQQVQQKVAQARSQGYLIELVQRNVYYY